jgi:hypothetical protein
LGGFKKLATLNLNDLEIKGMWLEAFCRIKFFANEGNIEFILKRISDGQEIISVNATISSWKNTYSYKSHQSLLIQSDRTTGESF